MISRRGFLNATFAGATAAAMHPLPAWAQAPAMQARPIPSTGEPLPVIGMGTSGSFEIAPGGAEFEALREVLARFFGGGGRAIDTAPTYGNAEDVLGELLTDAQRGLVFLATKLSGVTGREAGLRQFEDSLRRLRLERVALLQVHNLGDWRTQLALARELKAQGRTRYVGVTHYVDEAQDELAEVVQASKPDFLQINYSVASTSAEKRVLPLARDLGVAVLTNRNFDDGRLFSRVAGKAMPAWAGEVGATSWAQLFLKFALSHPAVTAVIPATGKPDRQSDNLKAGVGPLLDAKQKASLIAAIG